MIDKESEAAFFDAVCSTNSRASIGQIYSIIGGRDKRYRTLICDHVAGLRVLDYGCGKGSRSLELALHGAHVVGIDISNASIETARAEATARGIQSVEFQVMDAEALTFPAQSFDLVVGDAILHHLNLAQSFGEIARVLKSDGTAVFQEPLGHNPAIALFRRLTPRLRTKDEHPLLRRDLQVAKRFFGNVDVEYYHLTSFAALALLRTSMFFRAVEMLDKVDAALFRIVPPIRLLSWYVIMQLSRPRRTA